MVRKRSHSEQDIEPPEVDDLKVIYGIGPAVEQRLHGVGIYTFAQLAALSPADIAASVADLAGITAERIGKQDWIGQARHLATKLTAVEQQEINEVSPASQYVAALAETDTQQEIEVPEDPEYESVVIQAAVQEAREITVEAVEPVVRLKRLSGILHLCDLEMIETDDQSHHKILFSGRPFEVTLALDLADVVIPLEEPLTYTASLFGKSLDRQVRLLMGHTSGTIQPAEKAAIKVPCKVLPQGIYRLEALVTLNQSVSGQETRPGLTAQLEQRIVQFA